MIWKYILRSLYHYRRAHIWVVLGIMLATAILVGSLLVGDSIRYSLDQIVENRLGRTEFALSSGDRLFQADLAERLSEDLKNNGAALLQTKGIGIARGGRFRYNSVQVLGVDSSFGRIGSTSIFNQIAPDEVIVNSILAERLELSVGDELLLRIERLDQLPKDAPLALDDGSTVARRFTIKSIATLKEFGGFNLKTDQITPHTAFLSRSTLLQMMDLDNRANILLIAEHPENPLNQNRVTRSLKNNWRLADAGLSLHPLSRTSQIELRSNRIFLDASLESIILDSFPQVQPVFTYFVNQIRAGERSTPYSFVTAADDLFRQPFADDEIILNTWLAEDLHATPGMDVEISYFVIGPLNQLIEKKSTFTVHSIVPMRGRFADRRLMPDFPGLSEEENCLNWDPGIPIDLDLIRDKDENYWQTYKGVPKGFVTLNKAREMWGNRFGNLTALRFSIQDRELLEQKLNKIIDPSILGFNFRSVKMEGLRASSESVDFGQLFLGLSFFVIAAALILIGLLFLFNLENRSEETGLFKALGFPRQLTIRFILIESLLLAVAGSLAGGILGLFVNHGILLTLKTVWQGIVGTSALQSYVNLNSVLTGILAGIVMSFLVIWLFVRRQLKHSAVTLQKGLDKFHRSNKKSGRFSLGTGIITSLSILFIIFRLDPSTGSAVSGLYFTAGGLFIIAGLSFLHLFMLHLSGSHLSAKFDIRQMSLRNAARNRVRSLAFIGLLASGLFVVFTVGANRKSALPDSENPASGTGGFAFIGESSMPILEDLNSDKGRQQYGLEETSEDVHFIQFRVKEGDDASCLNLNRIAQPQIIGVDPDQMIRRDPFSFARTVEEFAAGKWSILDSELSDNVIPGIADLTVIIWGLGKSVGDTLTYQDEKGNTLKIKLMAGLGNSILQGNVVISEKEFLNRFPSISGYRLLLIDAPADQRDNLSNTISRSMQDEGLDLTFATTRLAAYNNIENTYLSIFLILGSFGLIIGSVGIMIVIHRNVNERKSELALFKAVGYHINHIQRLILFEHMFLIVAGILLGSGATIFSTLPSLLTPESMIPWNSILTLLILVVLNGIFWTMLATTQAMKGELVDGLREE